MIIDPDDKPAWLFAAVVVTTALALGLALYLGLKNG